MCFNVDYRQDKAKIAKKDIICYKYGYYEFEFFVSPYQDHYYKFGKLYGKIILKKTDGTTHMGYDIHEGFHSYKNINIAIKKSYGSYYYVECIIPKGSRYYENELEYVSNQIIIKNKIV